MWQTTRKKKLENNPKYSDELEEQNIIKILNEGNPNHAPKGDSKGGQFTKGDGGSGSDDDKDDTNSPKKVKYANSNNIIYKAYGKYKKMSNVQSFVNKSFDNIPSHLSIIAGDKSIILTDNPGKTKGVLGTFNHGTEDIKLRPSGDVDFNTNVLVHELAHKWDQEWLSDEKRKKWNESDIMAKPLTKYTKEILEKHGDKNVSKLPTDSKFNKFGNTFRMEQFAELQRLVFAPPTKYMGGKKLVDDKTFQKQREFFFELTSIWKPEDPRNPFVKKESTEDVALSGDHSRADVGKKKKKRFEFVEAIDDSWREVEHYLIEDSTNSGQKSDTVGNPEFKSFTHSSSFVGNVLWDRESREMDILLNGNKYHFCNVSERLFDSFEGAGSKGAFFNREIKTLHDC